MRFGVCRYAFATELAATKTVSDAAYWELQRLRGDAACVDLVGIVGYYTYVAMTLNTFGVVPK